MPAFTVPKKAQEEPASKRDDQALEVRTLSHAETRLLQDRVRARHRQAFEILKDK